MSVVLRVVVELLQGGVGRGWPVRDLEEFGFVVVGVAVVVGDVHS